MPWLTSLWVATALALSGCQKLGQPVPESNFVSLLNSGSAQAAQW